MNGIFPTMTNGARRPGRIATLTLVAAALAACDSSTGPSVPTTGGANVEVVLNSVDNSVTLVDPDGTGADAHTVGLGAAAASPVGVATRGAFAIVPEGTYPFAAVVSLRGGAVTASVALPQNSGATGAAFLNDTIALVGNPGRNTVSPVNIVRGTAGAEIPVGVYPQALVGSAAGGGNVYVLNANLVNFSPAGPGSVTIIGPTGAVAGTIPLTGINPSAGVVSGTRLYVINAGHFGANDGSLSVVNLSTRHEDAIVPGFGEFPGSIDVGPDGNVYVGVYGVGVVVWNPQTQQFVRGLNDPLVPGGAPPVSALAFDANGKLHTTNPGSCNAAGTEYRLNGTTVERTAATGICPFAIAFASFPSVD